MLVIVEVTESIEKKLKVPFHYVLMMLCCVVSVLLIVFVKSMVFSDFTIFVVAFFSCMKNLSDDEESATKWAHFWFLFVVIQHVSFLDVFSFLGYFKFFFLVYLAVYDDCTWLIQITRYLVDLIKSLFNSYCANYCEE